MSGDTSPITTDELYRQGVRLENKIDGLDIKFDGYTERLIRLEERVDGHQRDITATKNNRGGLRIGVISASSGGVVAAVLTIAQTLLHLH